MFALLPLIPFLTSVPSERGGNNNHSNTAFNNFSAHLAINGSGGHFLGVGEAEPEEDEEGEQEKAGHQRLQGPVQDTDPPEIALFARGRLQGGSTADTAQVELSRARRRFCHNELSADI